MGHRRTVAWGGKVVHDDQVPNAEPSDAGRERCRYCHLNQSVRGPPREGSANQISHQSACEDKGSYVNPLAANVAQHSSQQYRRREGHQADRERAKNYEDGQERKLIFGMSWASNDSDECLHQKKHDIRK